MNKLTSKRIIEYVIFNIRWLLIPFYVKLAFDILLLLYYLLTHQLDAHKVIFFVEDVDYTMIASLIEMTASGGYNSYVAKDHNYPNKNISSGELKTKMGTSIIGISSVHLLKVFVESEQYTTTEIGKKVAIHLAFIIGGFMVAVIDYLHSKSTNHETKPQHSTNHSTAKLWDKLSQTSPSKGSHL